MSLTAASPDIHVANQLLVEAEKHGDFQIKMNWIQNPVPKLDLFLIPGTGFGELMSTLFDPRAATKLFSGSWGMGHRCSVKFFL